MAQREARSPRLLRSPQLATPQRRATRCPLRQAVSPCRYAVSPATAKSAARRASPRLASCQSKLWEQSDPSCSVPLAWSASFKLDGSLGEGAFAKIFKVSDAKGGQFAMKVMDRPNFESRGIGKQIQAELEAMRKGVDIPNVVTFFDSVEERDHVYIRMELCDVTLLQFANQRPLAERYAKPFTTQLLLGLQGLHHKGILHRDIKAENLLIATNGDLRIADFGWCATTATKPCGLAGTFIYMAPEVLAGELQTGAVDVWSGGITMIMVIQNRPFLTAPGRSGLSDADPHAATRHKTALLLDEIRRICPPSDRDRPEDISAQCWSCLQSMLEPEASQRTSTQAALAHAWLRENKVKDVKDGKPKDASKEVKDTSVILKVPTPSRRRTPRKPSNEETDSLRSVSIPCAEQPSGSIQLAAMGALKLPTFGVESDTGVGEGSVTIASSVSVPSASTPSRPARANSLIRRGESPVFGSPCVRSPCFGSPVASKWGSDCGKWSANGEDSRRVRSVVLVRQRATIDGAIRQDLARSTLTRSPKEYSSPAPKLRTRTIACKAITRTPGSALPSLRVSPGREDSLSRTLPAASMEALGARDEDAPRSARLTTAASAHGWTISSCASPVSMSRTPLRRTALSPRPFSTPMSVRMQPFSASSVPRSVTLQPQTAK